MTELHTSVISLRWLRQGMMVLGVVIIASLVYSVFDPAPNAVLPEESLFEVQPLWPLVAAGTKAAETDAFVRRPLFAKTRRPPPPQPKPKPEAKAEVVETASPEGLELVGVYGAGDTLGAIVRFEDGNVRRVRLGMDIVKGWTLDEVESRKILLTASNGSRLSVMEMKFAAVTPLPESLSQSDRTSESGVSSASASSQESLDEENRMDSEQEASSENLTDTLTFDNMYKRVANKKND